MFQYYSLLFHQAVTGPQTINGVLFVRAPTFPTGDVQPHRVVGVLFTKAPAFPTGQVNLRLFGATFTRTPTFPTGDVQPQPVTLTGVLFSRAPTFPTGQVNLRIFADRFLNLPGTSGHFASTPDTAAVDITGDIWLAGRVALDDWTPGVDNTVVAKWVVSGNQRSYRLEVETPGQLRLNWTTDGTAGTENEVDSTVDPTVSDGGRLWVAGTLDVSTGDVKFYTGGVGKIPVWVQLGSTISGSGATSIFSGTAPVEVGSINAGANNRLTGKVFNAQIENGYDVGGGSLVADFDANDFALGDSDTDTALDSTGKTWTINGASSVIEDQLFTRAPTFPTGQVNLQITGTLFAQASTFATGQVNLQLNGVLFTRASTFPTGAVQAQPVTLNGVLFVRAGTFPTGAVNLAATITGVLFPRAPTFPTGQVTLQLFGAATFQRSPTFAIGSINLQLSGVLFTQAGTFPTGAVNAQPVTISGVLFTATVIFPTGSITLVSATFWVDDKVVQTTSSLSGDNKVAYTKLQPSVPNPL